MYHVRMLTFNPLQTDQGLKRLVITFSTELEGDMRCVMFSSYHVESKPGFYLKC
jgi:hypothetical protein